MRTSDSPGASGAISSGEPKAAVPTTAERPKTGDIARSAASATSTAAPHPFTVAQGLGAIETERPRVDVAGRVEQALFDALKRHYDVALTVFLAVADGVGVVISFFLALLLQQITIDWWQFYPRLLATFGGAGADLGPAAARELMVGLAAWTPAFFVPVFWLFGLYQREISIMNVGEVRKIVRGALFGGLVFAALLFFLPGTKVSRLIIVYVPFTMIAVMVTLRTAFFQIHQRYHARGLGVHRVLVYGAGQTGRRLVRKLQRSGGLGYHPVGFVDDDESKRGMRVPIKDGDQIGLPVLGTFENLRWVVENAQIHHVFVAVPSLAQERSLEILRVCNELGIGFSVIPALYNLIVHQVAWNEIEGIPLITLKSLRYRAVADAIKRLFDIVFASLVLFLLAPLLLLLAIAVRLDSPGPAFFSHIRVGKDGKPFLIHKFRSMYTSAPPHGVTPRDPTDPRITRLGAILRRFSLDELPQFVNVLKGDMSTVGPRPEMPFIVALYDDFQRQRLNVKPGVTGLWQISDDRAGEIHANMDYDIYYIENQGFLLDIIIILATVFFAMRGRGAI